MARYAIVKKNIVVNVIEWDGVTPWTPPEGCTAILESDLPVQAPTAADPNDYIPPEDE